jgi:hypothetical protein
MFYVVFTSLVCATYTIHLILLDLITLINLVKNAKHEVPHSIYVQYISFKPSATSCYFEEYGLLGCNTVYVVRKKFDVLEVLVTSNFRIQEWAKQKPT